MRNKSGVSFFINTLGASGGTQRMLSLLTNILIQNFRVTIFHTNSDKPFYTFNEKVEFVHIQGGLFNRNLLIRKYLEKNNIKYFVSLDSNTVLLQTLFLPLNTKLIIWEHFSIANNYNKWFFKLSRKYAVNRAYKFVLLSDFEAQKWKELYKLPDNKRVRVYNPVTVACDANKEASKYQSKTFLAIGNKIDVKGFDLLLAAWKQIADNWTLKIVGLSTEEIDVLNQQIQEEQIQNILIYPKTTDIKEFYKEASVFVLSSRKEATPLVLIESQSYGLPAIVFDHLPSVAELIDNSALIADFDAPIDSLKGQIEQIIINEKLYNELSDNAYKNATKFSVESFKNHWMRLLK